MKNIEKIIQTSMSMPLMGNPVIESDQGDNKNYIIDESSLVYGTTSEENETS